MVFEEQFWTFIRDMNTNFMFLVSIKRNTKFSKNVSPTSSKYLCKHKIQNYFNIKYQQQSERSIF